MLIRITGFPGFFLNSDLLDLADPFGQVVSAHIVIDPVTQKSKRLGFIEMSSHDEGIKLIEVMNGKSLAPGQTLKLLEVSRRH